MKGEGKSSRRLTQVDAAGGETSVCVVTGLLYPQGESGAAATEKTRVLRVGCRAGIKIARGGRFVPSSSCYRLKLTGPLRPVHISIPALRAEGDFFEPAGQSQTFIPAFTQRVTGLPCRSYKASRFLPTPSVWRETAYFHQLHQPDGPLSTHALRMEGDAITIALNQIFSLSTHALTWRATDKFKPALFRRRISTHALTWRATVQARLHASVTQFLPTPSHGGRRSMRR